MNRTSNEPFALAAGKLPTWIWIVVLVPAACAVDDRNPGVAGTAACDAIEQGNIERSVACSGISRDALTTARKAFDPCTLVAASQAAGALATDEATLTACLNDLATAVCGVETPRCRQALVGKLGEGAPCYPLANWEECAPGYHCMMDSCPGTCVRYAQLGEACSLDSSLGPACDPSLYCDGNASTCVAPIGPPTVNVGDSCSPYGCNNLVCKGPNGPLLVSDPNMPGTCQPASANGPCNYATDCIGRCVGATPPSTPGVCMPWRQIGDTCRPGAGECSRGTYCGPENRCILFPVLGESCTGYEGEGMDCIDSWCDGALCVEYAKPGQSCMRGGFLHDSCGAFVNQCDQFVAVCLPACSRVTTCGAIGQMCCAGLLCQSGAVCMGTTCVAG